MGALEKSEFSKGAAIQKSLGTTGVYVMLRSGSPMLCVVKKPHVLCLGYV